MSGLKLAAIVGAEALGLAYGAFSYNRETHHASVGPMEISVSEHRTVPVWAGVGTIVVGAVLLLVGKKSEA